MDNGAQAKLNQYLRTRVMSATPEELRMMLLDGALKFARQGRDGIAQKNFEQSFNGLTNCRNIVMELLTTIREELNPELAAQVKSLYTFIYKLLVEGGHEKDLAKLDQAIQLLEYERETWELLMQRLAAERGLNSLSEPSESAPAERAPMSLQG